MPNLSSVYPISQVYPFSFKHAPYLIYVLFNQVYTLSLKYKHQVLPSVYPIYQVYTPSIKCIPFPSSVYLFYQVYTLSLECMPYLSSACPVSQVYTPSFKCILYLSIVYVYPFYQVYPFSIKRISTLAKCIYAFSLKCISFIKYNTQACKDPVQI